MIQWSQEWGELVWPERFGWSIYRPVARDPLLILNGLMIIPVSLLLLFPFWPVFIILALSFFIGNSLIFIYSSHRRLLILDHGILIRWGPIRPPEPSFLAFDDMETIARDDGFHFLMRDGRQYRLTGACNAIMQRGLHPLARHLGAKGEQTDSWGWLKIDPDTDFHAGWKEWYREESREIDPDTGRWYLLYDPDWMDLSERAFKEETKYLRHTEKEADRREWRFFCFGFIPGISVVALVIAMGTHSLLERLEPAQQILFFVLLMVGLLTPVSLSVKLIQYHMYYSLNQGTALARIRYALEHDKKEHIPETTRRLNRELKERKRSEIVLPWFVPFKYDVMEDYRCPLCEREFPAKVAFYPGQTRVELYCPHCHNRFIGHLDKEMVREGFDREAPHDASYSALVGMAQRRRKAGRVKPFFTVQKGLSMFSPRELKRIALVTAREKFHAFITTAKVIFSLLFFLSMALTVFPFFVAFLAVPAIIYIALHDSYELVTYIDLYQELRRYEKENEVQLLKAVYNIPLDPDLTDLPEEFNK